MEKRDATRTPLTKQQLLGIANYLTYGRILMIPIVILFMSAIHDHDFLRFSMNRMFSWLAAASFIIAQSSDMVDGYYARKFGVISSFGKFIDPLADKLLSMSVLIMFVQLDRVPAWIVILFMAREVTITGLRSVAAAEGLEIAASDWGKLKTFVQSFTIGAFLIYYPFWGLNPKSVGWILIWPTLAISWGSAGHYTFVFFREVFERKKQN